MQPAVLMGFEMGTHTVPIAFDSPLCWIFWVCLLLGWGVQTLLQRRRSLRFVWVGFLLAGLLGCEAACQSITGWDVILWVILYFYLLTMLAGALAGMLIRRLCRKSAA